MSAYSLVTLLLATLVTTAAVRMLPAAYDGGGGAAHSPQPSTHSCQPGSAARSLHGSNHITNFAVLPPPADANTNASSKAFSVLSRAQQTALAATDNHSQPGFPQEQEQQQQSSQHCSLIGGACVALRRTVLTFLSNLTPWSLQPPSQNSCLELGASSTVMASGGKQHDPVPASLAWIGALHHGGHSEGTSLDSNTDWRQLPSLWKWHALRRSLLLRASNDSDVLFNSYQVAQSVVSEEPPGSALPALNASNVSSGAGDNASAHSCTTLC